MFESPVAQLTELGASAAELAGLDFRACSDADLQAAAHAWCTAKERLDAAGAALFGEWESRGGWVGDGATSGTAWLRAHGHGIGAKHRLEVARNLRYHAPVTAAALAAGSITYEHAAALAERVPDKLADAFQVHEPALVEAARHATVAETRRIADQWRQAAEAALAEDVEEKQRRSQYVRIFNAADGMVEGSFRLEPGQGALLWAHLDARERVLYRDDVRNARAAAGLGPHDPSPDGLELPRSPGERRADALCELVESGARLDPTKDDGGLGGPAAEIVLTMTPEHLAAAADADHHDSCGCGDGTCDGALLDDHDQAVPASLVVMLACDSVIVRMALDAKGVPLDLGRGRRLATREQRRALRKRDGGCAFPGCDRPASWCDAHHIIHWLLGGLTDLDNLVLLCRKHHGYMHQKKPWRCVMDKHTRRPGFYDPDGNLIRDPGVPANRPDAHPTRRRRHERIAA